LRRQDNTKIEQPTLTLILSLPEGEADAERQVRVSPKKFRRPKIIRTPRLAAGVLPEIYRKAADTAAATTPTNNGTRRSVSLQLFGSRQIPIDSDDAIVVEGLERFRKDEKDRAFARLESGEAEIGPALTFLNGHDAIAFDHRLQMSILRRFHPKRVDLGFACRIDNIGEAHGFGFQQFHSEVEWLSG
jgi:hypothetical protein